MKIKWWKLWVVYVLVVTALLTALYASAAEVVEVDRANNQITLDNGFVIQMEDVIDVNIGDEVEIQRVEPQSAEDYCERTGDCEEDE